MRGYTGSDSLLRLFMSQLRKQQNAGTSSVLTLDASGAHVNVPDDSKPVPSPTRRLSPTRVSWFCVCQPDRLDEKQRQHVEHIRAAHCDLDTAYQLSQAFVSMLAEHRDQDLDGWLIQAKQSGMRELKSFAQASRAISAPACASARAVALPSPLLAPVTRATCPLSASSLLFMRHLLSGFLPL
jgi:Transposase